MIRYKITRSQFLSTVAGSFVLALATNQLANAQSMTPMRGEVRSFTDEFAVRVYPKNPYQHRIKVEVHVYDQDFRLVEARVSPQEMTLGTGASRPVLVAVGFDGSRERKVRICTESIPFPNEKQLVRTQICGKFIATNMQ